MFQHEDWDLLKRENANYLYVTDLQLIREDNNDALHESFPIFILIWFLIFSF
jgi:hypothetical protein